MASKNPTACINRIAVLRGVGRRSKKRVTAMDDVEYASRTKWSDEQLSQKENIRPVAGNKNRRKGVLTNLEHKENVLDDKKVEEEDVYAPFVQILRKKNTKLRNSGTNNVFATSSFELLMEKTRDEDEKLGVTRDDDEGTSDEEQVHKIACKCKNKRAEAKKRSSFEASAFNAFFDDDDKGEVLNALDSGFEDESAEFFETEKPFRGTSIEGAGNFNYNKLVLVDVPETSMNKKKKKKSGRAAQEEVDLEKLLAELSDGPTTSKPSPETPSTEEKGEVQSHPDEIVAAAAKKKKKNKKKAKTADVTQEEIINGEEKGKAVDKKVQKHVRLLVFGNMMLVSRYLRLAPYITCLIILKPILTI